MNILQNNISVFLTATYRVNTRTNPGPRLVARAGISDKTAPVFLAASRVREEVAK